MRKEKLYKLYNIAICVMAVLSVIFAIIDFTKGLNSTLMIVDNVIYWIFVDDYVVRFAISKSKIEFVKSNILDLIAIIPFNSAFRIFRTFRIFKAAKLLKLFKLFRIGSVSARCFKKTKRFFNTNGFKYVIMISAGAILVSAVLMTYAEKMQFSDALWWAFVTATTVGYGDLSPATGVGRIIASVLMLVGIGLIGSLTSSITSYFMSGVSEEKCSNEKIEMALVIYDKLNDDEKSEFKRQIESE